MSEKMGVIESMQAEIAKLQGESAELRKQLDEHIAAAPAKFRTFKQLEEVYGVDRGTLQEWLHVFASRGYKVETGRAGTSTTSPWLINFAEFEAARKGVFSEPYVKTMEQERRGA